jgi:hypothetical protein
MVVHDVLLLLASCVYCSCLLEALKEYELENMHRAGSDKRIQYVAVGPIKMLLQGGMEYGFFVKVLGTLSNKLARGWLGIRVTTTG